MDMRKPRVNFEKHRLEAEFREDCTVQSSKVAASAAPVQQFWERARPLGSGRFGQAWQERLQSNHGEWLYRAVKVCSLEQLNLTNVDYKRDICSGSIFILPSASSVS